MVFALIANFLHDLEFNRSHHINVFVFSVALGSVFVLKMIHSNKYREIPWNWKSAFSRNELINVSLERSLHGVMVIATLFPPTFSHIKLLNAYSCLIKCKIKLSWFFFSSQHPCFLIDHQIIWDYAKKWNFQENSIEKHGWISWNYIIWTEWTGHLNINSSQQKGDYFLFIWYRELRIRIEFKLILQILNFFSKPIFLRSSMINGCFHSLSTCFHFYLSLRCFSLQRKFSKQNTSFHI